MLDNITLQPKPQELPFTPPGFIVGVGRSGTTLLASILNRHPDVAVTSETHYFNLVGQNGGWDAITRDWPTSAIEFVNNLHHFYLLGIHADQVVLRAKSQTISSLFLSLGNTFAECKNKTLWIEKTPLHLRYIHQIRSMFPNSPIIQILRDGRDVALSLMKVEWASDSYTQNLYRWYRETEDAAAFFASDPNSLIVRYEDILQAPTETIGHTCRFLGIPFVDEILTPDGSETYLIEKDTNIKDNVTKPLMTDNTRKWESQLPPDLTLGTQWLFEGHLARRGYRITADAPRRQIVLCRDLLVNDDPEHLDELPLGDYFVRHMAGKSLGISLEDGELFTAPIRKNEAIRILRWQFPVAEVTKRGNLWGLWMLAKILARIIVFRARRIHYVWIASSIPARSTWALRRLTESTVAAYAYRVVHDSPSALTESGELPISESTLHTKHPAFQDRLTKHILADKQWKHH